MRTFILLVILLFLRSSYLLSQDELTIVSYNIWYDNPNNDGHSWLERKSSLLHTLEDLNPDIFCVQEALNNQVRDLEILSYKHFGVGRDDGKMVGEYAAIFYDSIRFNITAGGNFWLSETPDLAGSIGWDAACVRIVTWVELLDKETGITFFTFNTHFDHMGSVARLQSAKLILRKISDIAGNDPIILTGDFNCRIDSEPYKLLSAHNQDKPLKDTRYATDGLITHPEYSFVGAHFIGNSGDIIDHIFVSDDFQVVESRIIDNCLNKNCPSDHLPVLSKLLYH